MIKLTLKQIVPMIESLNSVSSLPLPAKEAYRFALATKSIQEKIQAYEQTRQSLITRYGEKTKDDKGEDVIRVKNENMNDFVKEIDSLLSETIEINMPPISIDLLGDAKLTTVQMNLLSPFFYDPNL